MPLKLPTDAKQKKQALLDIARGRVATVTVGDVVYTITPRKGALVKKRGGGK